MNSKKGGKKQKTNEKKKTMTNAMRTQGREDQSHARGLTMTKVVIHAGWLDLTTSTT